MEQLKTGFLLFLEFRCETRLFRPTVRTKGRYKSTKKQKLAAGSALALAETEFQSAL